LFGNNSLVVAVLLADLEPSPPRLKQAENIIPVGEKSFFHYFFQVRMDEVLAAISEPSAGSSRYEDSYHSNNTTTNNNTGRNNNNNNGSSSSSSSSNAAVVVQNDDEAIRKCQDNCNKLLFSDLCQKFEEVEKTSGSEKKFLIIFNKGLKTYLANQSMYPLMRLVLPSIDTERGKYGLKQTAVSNIYVDALQLDKHRSKDAQALINWKV
jgi:hypothetical protein